MNAKEIINNIHNSLVDIKQKENFINMYLDTITYDFPFISLKTVEKCLLSNRYLITTKDNKYTINGLEKVHLSNKEVIDISREIINDIDPNLVNKFDEMVNNNKIKLIKSEIRDLRKDHPAYYKSYKDNIILYKNPDYYTICVLVHEFMHVTNHKGDLVNKETKIDGILRREFTEFVSIYFEFYAREYLMNKYNVENNMIDFSERFNPNYDLAKRDLYNYLPYLCYKVYDVFDYESFQNIIEDYNLQVKPTEYKDVVIDFYKINKRFIDNSISSENNYDKFFEMLWNSICDDNYVLSTILYFSVHDKLSKEDILRFNTAIGKNNGDLAKYRDPNFRLVVEKYKRLLVDEEAYYKLSEFIEAMYTKEGILRKEYVRK